MEQLTKDELAILANMLSNANVSVKEAEVFIALLKKIMRMIQEPKEV